MIIGLSGKKGSGKDTIAAYLEQYGFERRAFADPLKKSIAAFFGIPFHEVDQYKNNIGIVVILASGVPDVEKGDIMFDRFDREMTFREALQRYGTEAHRDVFGEDFWIDQTLPLDGFYAGRKIVITDNRFENEAQRIRDLGGFNVEVLRPGLEQQDQHSSEQPLSPVLIDYTLDNDDTLDFLVARIDVMLERLAEL